MANGDKAYCDCVAFGMERTTLALFHHHGFDPAAWPSDIRSILFED